MKNFEDRYKPTCIDDIVYPGLKAGMLLASELEGSTPLAKLLTLKATGVSTP